MSRPRAGAFTLLELVLVLVVISTILAVAAPSLRGFMRGAKLRDAAGQFVAITQWARTQAVTTCKVHRLQFDTREGVYWLTAQDGEEFVELRTGLGQKFDLPSGFRMQVEVGTNVSSASAGGSRPGSGSGPGSRGGSAAGGGLGSGGSRLAQAASPTPDFVEFYPTGRTMPARVRITADDGETVDIECRSPAETFRVLKPGEVSR